MACSPVLSSMYHSGSGGSGMADAGMLSQDIVASTLVRDLRNLRPAQRSSACSPRLPGVEAPLATVRLMAPLRGSGALRAIDSSTCPRLGRPLAGAAFGGNLKPDLVATQGGTA